MTKQSPTSWDPLDALSDVQREMLDTFQQLLLHFNSRINLISREDEAHVVRHVLHALAFTWRGFPAGSIIVDWGTGGGLPAIPLAICYPSVQVHAVDAVGKKVQAVRMMARRLGLENLYAWHGRAEEWPGRAQYSVSRATAPLERLWRWHVRISEEVRVEGGSGWPPGLFCLKGGDLRSEIADLKDAFPSVSIERHALRPWLDDPFFTGKYLVEVH